MHLASHRRSNIHTGGSTALAAGTDLGLFGARSARGPAACELLAAPSFPAPPSPSSTFNSSPRRRRARPRSTPTDRLRRPPSRICVTCSPTVASSDAASSPSRGRARPRPSLCDRLSIPASCTLSAPCSTTTRPRAASRLAACEPGWQPSATPALPSSAWPRASGVTASPASTASCAATRGRTPTPPARP